MSHQEENITMLLEKFANRQASRQELEQLLALVKQNQHDEAVVSFITQQLASFEPDNAEEIQFWHERFAHFRERFGDSKPITQPVHRVHFLKTAWFRYAAVIIILFGVGTYIWTANKKNTQSPIIAEQTTDIAPGKDGAILTLADGSQVVLDSLGNGVIALQNGSQAVIKNGELVYDLTGEKTGDVTYNTMTTPKGRQYQVTLPDGTKVWLNAASSIRYPTVFTGKERQVEIKGEVYFEVQPNKQKPFIVTLSPAGGGGRAPRDYHEAGGGYEADNYKITVLGTSFNVNSYPEEPSVKTSLLEGSVKVNNSILKPGQAYVNGEVMVTNIEQDMAWKNGLFNFNGLAFEEIMRQLERWYDIEVTYEHNKIPNKRLAGKMTRGVSLNGVLNYLEKMDVHYTLDNRKLIVLSK